MPSRQLQDSYCVSFWAPSKVCKTNDEFPTCCEAHSGLLRGWWAHLQCARKDLDGLCVQVIGRLIQQQQVGGHKRKCSQSHTGLLTT